MTKLALFFDGTWNEPNDRTNAYLLYKLAPETDDQETLYVPGVGTQGNGLFSLANKFLGGAFGDGLSANIKSGYAWLCQRYQPGASIYILGFSRGAYSARSLAGLIRKCGLANDWNDDSIRQAYGIYRDQSVSADDDSVKAYRQQFSREVDVAFIGATLSSPASCNRRNAWISRKNSGAPDAFGPPSALPFCRPAMDCAVMRNSRSIGMPLSASGSTSVGGSGRM